MDDDAKNENSDEEIDVTVKRTKYTQILTTWLSVVNSWEFVLALRMTPGLYLQLVFAHCICTYYICICTLYL